MLLGKYLASLVSKILPFRRGQHRAMPVIAENEKRRLWNIKSYLTGEAIQTALTVNFPSLIKILHFLIKLAFIALYYQVLYE